MRRNSGFTLIELILVTVIIGILAGAVAVSVRGRVGQSSAARAKHDVVMYEGAVDTYAIEHQDRYPKTLKELAQGGKYVKRYAKDPWGNDYVYEVPGKHNRESYDIYSKGPDGQAGTPDDISNWDLE